MLLAEYRLEEMRVKEHLFFGVSFWTVEASRAEIFNLRRTTISTCRRTN
jgi:hypothetical protein